ncbi:hypothetical protein [Streptomyces sp. NBC_00572]|uniref:hypothetical protein n=1 Tax=Streptomyces sp. NBC_00572 TaxID=2903664 RepID=UPI00224D145C|nr:hypothetical protein [Streptomyces sp. NBC_00572]MCX4980291.1 hypothetical protein [Streptomyces sp. NBC_00572]
MSPISTWQRKPFPPTAARTDFVWEVWTDGDGVQATGPCPECRCTTRNVITGTQFATKGPSRQLRDLVASAEPKYAACQCTTWHLSRPDGITAGCGASFYIALPAQGLPL